MAFSGNPLLMRQALPTPAGPFDYAALAQTRPDLVGHLQYLQPRLQGGGWDLLPQDVKDQLLANPDLLLKAAWSPATGWNSGNNSVFSINTGGGWNEDAYRNAQFDPVAGIKPFDSSNYVDITHSGGLGGLTNLAIGGLLGGMAGGALGSEALGSGITGNQANYGQAAGIDVTGLAAGTGLSGAMAPGLSEGAAWGAGLEGTPGYEAMLGNVGLGSEGAAWGAGLEGTPGYESMLNNVGLGPEGAYGSPLYNPDPFSNLTPADLGQEVMPWSMNPSLEDLGGNINPATGFPFPTGPGGTNVFPNPLGGNGQGQGGGSGGYDWAGAAVSTAPILAAINYAKNQGPFDTSKFEDLYKRYSPEAMTGQYDLNTSLERGALSNSLAARGLSGSTFGNEAITNYGTARDIGRSELLSRAALQAGGLADPILQAQIKERALRNDLYGRGLYALGNVFGGRGGGGGGGGSGGGGGGGGATLTDQLRSGYNTVKKYFNY